MRNSTLMSVFGRTLAFISITSLANPAFAVISRFDNDLEGWSSNVPSELSWADTGGNLGGYARFDDSSGSGAFLFAPNIFLGDWTSLDGGNGSVSFDHILRETGFIGSGGILPYEVVISGGGSSAQWLGTTPSGATDWVSIQAPIIESEWIVTGTWSDILSNVQEFRVRIELVDNDASANRDIAGLDNIQVSSVPIPATVWLFGSGLLGLIGVARRKTA